jgi:LAO/AO transport system kinase
MNLYDYVLQGNKRFTARLITLVEGREREALDVYEKLYKHTGRAKKIGITGPPGAGKRTMLDLLVRHL